MWVADYNALPASDWPWVLLGSNAVYNYLSKALLNTNNSMNNYIQNLKHTLHVLNNMLPASNYVVSLGTYDARLSVEANFMGVRFL